MPSELLSTYMYKKAFSNNQYGYGSALAVFIIIESMLVVFILRKIFSERKECKESMKKKIGKIVFAIVILAFLLIQVYPIIWLFMASVKPTIELSTTPFALPKVVTFENFIKVFSDGKIGFICG